MTEVCKVRLLHKHSFADSNHKNFIAHYIFSEFRVFIVGKMQLDFYCCLKIQKKTHLFLFYKCGFIPVKIKLYFCQ